MLAARLRERPDASVTLRELADMLLPLAGARSSGDGAFYPAKADKRPREGAGDGPEAKRARADDEGTESDDADAATALAASVASAVTLAVFPPEILTLILERADFDATDRLMHELEREYVSSPMRGVQEEEEEATTTLYPTMRAIVQRRAVDPSRRDQISVYAESALMWALLYSPAGNRQTERDRELVSRMPTSGKRPDRKGAYAVGEWTIAAVFPNAWALLDTNETYWSRIARNSDSPDVRDGIGRAVRDSTSRGRMVPEKWEILLRDGGELLQSDIVDWFREVPEQDQYAVGPLITIYLSDAVRNAKWEKTEAAEQYMWSENYRHLVTDANLEKIFRYRNSSVGPYGWSTRVLDVIERSNAIYERVARENMRKGLPVNRQNFAHMIYPHPGAGAWNIMWPDGGLYYSAVMLDRRLIYEGEFEYHMANKDYTTVPYNAGDIPSIFDAYVVAIDGGAIADGYTFAILLECLAAIDNRYRVEWDDEVPRTYEIAPDFESMLKARISRLAGRFPLTTARMRERIRPYVDAIAFDLLGALK